MLDSLCCSKFILITLFQTVDKSHIREAPPLCLLQGESGEGEADVESGYVTPWKRKPCNAKDGSNSKLDNNGLDEEHSTRREYMGPYDDDENEEGESRFVEIPLQGLVFSAGALAGDAMTQPPIATCRIGTKRCVPAFCAICLSCYEPGNTIVWSSNRLCPHVFHEECIKQWLIKLPQREGAACPCCRRDFLIDPYDLMLAAMKGDDEEQNRALVAETHNHALQESRTGLDEGGAVQSENIFRADPVGDETLNAINLSERDNEENGQDQSQ